MEEELKSIICKYLKSDPSDINDSSDIRLKGSILVHRMFAAISGKVNINFDANEYMYINTFGELKKLIDTKKEGHTKEWTNEKPRTKQTEDLPEDDVAVGIDIEDVANFPQTVDFREDRFYISNFSQKEISYCILQPDPYMSFAGKFAAKEALYKAGIITSQKNFSEFEILNNKNGAPVYSGASLSVSHNKDHAVAVALKFSEKPEVNPAIQDKKETIKLKNSINSLTTDLISARKSLKIMQFIVAVLLVVVLLDAVNII